MMLTSDILTCSFVTVHVGYHEVPGLLSVERITEVIELTRKAMRRIRGKEPKIVVCGLNPHAGDNGNFGTEEIDILAPAIESAQKMQMDVNGPWPSDTVFLKGRGGLLDAVVTMYHDQGQIAMKLMGFERGVTIAGGLPIPVATPAHGTAFDIAGKGIANLGATRKAFDVLCRMADHHRRGQTVNPAT